MIKSCNAAAALLAALLAACSGSGIPASGVPGAMPGSRGLPSPNYAVLHSFGISGDGSGPEGSLVNVNGKLYGTTARGGQYAFYGTVFSIAPSGTESVLHSFGPSGDGATPRAGLVNVKDTLYGTTEFGGAYGAGTAFAITTSGTESVLHSFGASADGVGPIAGLISVKGRLYGTTAQGGANTIKTIGLGTVFSLGPFGGESVLHNFGGLPVGDGATPQAGLVTVKGTLYGTTAHAGANGPGTVFSITTSGTESVLHSFGWPVGDGAEPDAGLIDVEGTLYGTTE